MPKIISPEVINDIQDRCDIVELISSYIPLKKAGRNFKAPCPFHSEKTPSFVVSPDKQIYHCFGCGEGGNALNFLMKYERMDFKEAVETLAKRAGIAIEFQETQNDKDKSYVSELYRINELACDFYQNYLIKNCTPQLENYLNSRNLKNETIKKFKIGLAPNQWDGLLNYLRSKSINISLIEKAGLIIQKEGGGFYDRFRNRLIIPVFDIRNRVIAFGARILDDGQPKYINSPETPIYIKGKNLFGLNLSKDAIRDQDSCIITEGYFDVISPMQEGLLNITCSSGTALTIDQIRLIKRYTKNVVVIYDADKAGQLATLRSLDLFLSEDTNVKVVNLPKGFDPDLFVRKSGVEELKELINNSLDIFDYKLKILFGLYDINKVSEKTKIALEMLSLIKKVKNEILKSEYIKLLAERLSIEENLLLKEMAKINIGQQVQQTMSAEAQQKIKNSFDYISPKAERMLIKLILEDIDAAKGIKDFVNPDDLQDARLQKILKLVFDIYGSYTELKPNQIINHLDDENCINLISELSNEETLLCKAEDRQSILLDCVKRIKFNSVNRQCQNLHTKIKNAQSEGDNECVHRLMQEFNILIKGKSKIHEENRN